jgi:uncharacterized protein with HEPN domain
VSRETRLFLEDIEKSCAKIVRYTEGLGRDQVFVDEMRFDAVLSSGMRFERISLLCWAGRGK